MKKLASIALLLATLAAPKAHAVEPWWYPETKLEQPVQINGLWYVPVSINNPGLWNIHNFWGWGDTDADLELTGTLRPASPNAGMQGHLTGNYWGTGYSESSITRNWGGDSTSAFGKWKLNIQGSFDPVRNSVADCQSSPSETNGVLAYIHLIGTGTMRMTRNYMWSGTPCDFPYFHYEWMANDCYNSVYIDDNPPTCYDCGEEGGGGDDPMGHLKAGAEAPKEVKAAKRTTWGSIKALYR